ncbi:hypothetical protein U8527_01535 [Kordia algicida OT-1]|uniref:Uncharacterized protein n=1 Tax=Kordia algicida OT-1 TaxID=391587 RepID=A9DST7_9FLAO|nr:hypothetical protein [Kordia algicida]EDP96980.1 hypothetical protein KAOT1_17493 [Kordia algicida OT-1]
MKLTQEQIQYIDDYLQRSGVTYWDVRAELLDHIASAIEEEITTNKSTFEEALKSVSLSFGNQVRKGYILNKDNTKWIPAGTFSDGEGFKKLQREKQKQIGKKNLKAYWKQVCQLFFSARFYAEFLLMILLVMTTAQYSEKTSLLLGFIYLFYPFLPIGYKYFKGEIPKKSLHIHMSMIGLVLWLNLFNLVPNGYQIFFDTKLDFQIYAWMLILVFPFIKASFVRYHTVCKEYKKQYDLIKS